MQRSKAEQPQASDEDEAKGRAAYEKAAAGWPSPIGWDNLMKSQQYLWIQRATKGHK